MRYPHMKCDVRLIVGGVMEKENTQRLEDKVGNKTQRTHNGALPDVLLPGLLQGHDLTGGGMTRGLS